MVVPTTWNHKLNKNSIFLNSFWVVVRAEYFFKLHVLQLINLKIQRSKPKHRLDSAPALLPNTPSNCTAPRKSDVLLMRGHCFTKRINCCTLYQRWIFNSEILCQIFHVLKKYEQWRIQFFGQTGAHYEPTKAPPAEKFLKFGTPNTLKIHFLALSVNFRRSKAATVNNNNATKLVNLAARL